MQMLAVLTFAAPVMLLGIAGVAAPLIAHLLAKRASRRVVFPSIRLIRDAAAGRSRLHRLRSRTLLLLRALAVAAIALAFAQPLWLDAAAPPTDGATAYVFVIDNSASSAQLVDGVPLIQSLRIAAEREAAKIAETDRVGLVLAARPAHAAWPGLSAGSTFLKEQLTSLKPASTRADIEGALRIAEDQFREHHGPKQIVVFSDMQATNWPSRLPTMLTPVRIVAISADRDQNLSLRKPAVWPVAPRAGRPVTLSVEVANHSPRPASVSVAAMLDGEDLAAEAVTVEGRSSRRVAFRARVAAGFHEVTFALPADALDIDNRTSLPLRVASHTTVMVVSEHDPAQIGSGAYFVDRALAPRGDHDPVRVRHVRPDALRADAFADVGVALLVLDAALPRKGLDAFRGFVERGGSMILLAGQRADAAAVQRLDDAMRDLGGLPCKPLQRRDASGLRLEAADTNTSPFVGFDSAAQRALSRVRLREVWSVTAAADATNHLTFSDGTPALSERHAGAGRIAMANFSPDLSDGDLPTHAMFPALLHALLEYLEPAPSGLAAVTVGKTIDFPFNGTALGLDAAAVEVIAPDATRQPARWTSIEGRLRTQITADQVGTYRLIHVDDVLAAVVSRVDPLESDLAVTQSFEASTNSGLAEPITSNADPSTPKDLWHWVLGLAAILFAAELTALKVWKT
jgi:hypothetical protein